MAILQTKFQIPHVSGDAQTASETAAQTAFVTQAANETMSISVRGEWFQAPVLRVNGQDIVTTGKRIRLAAMNDEEWLESEVENPEGCIRRLKAAQGASRADIFRFSQKVPATVPVYKYPVEMSSVAVARITTYANWWQKIPSNTRQNIRRSQKRGVVIKVRALEQDVIQGICEVQNETPVRQGKPYPHFGRSFDEVRRNQSSFADRSDFLCAYFEGEFIGFLKLVYRGNVASILQLNTKTAHSDKRPSNALFAQAVAMCEQRGIAWLTYGNFNYCNKGVDSLCQFKMRHGFSEMLVPTYYVPLTPWGRVCVLLKLYRKPQAILPASLRAIARKMRAKWYALSASGNHGGLHPTSTAG